MNIRPRKFIMLFNYTEGDGEFNLRREFRRLVENALAMDPKDNNAAVATRLGISTKLLLLICKEWGLPIRERKTRTANKNRKYFR